MVQRIYASYMSLHPLSSSLLCALQSLWCVWHRRRKRRTAMTLSPRSRVRVLEFYDAPRTFACAQCAPSQRKSGWRSFISRLKWTSERARWTPGVVWTRSIRGRCECVLATISLAPKWIEWDPPTQQHIVATRFFELTDFCSVPFFFQSIWLVTNWPKNVLVI